MRTKIIFFLAIFFIIFAAFSGMPGGERISAKDVAFSIPAGFPKPAYNFKTNPLSTERFELGRNLFYDPLLSKDSTVSCQSCHQRVAAFAHIDHALSHGIDAKIGTRNVPALQNLIWKDTYMWDGGVNNLEMQPVNPITSSIEMNETLANVVLKLKSSKKYKALFKLAYNDTVINSERILKSLAQFTGLMISCNSRYDKYMAGKDTFSIQEKNGLSLFRDKCASCHAGPLFTDNSYRNNGLKPDTSLNDSGRGKISGIKSDDFKFKVPGLRNIEMTFPYMHDGRFRKLKDVLAHYSDSDSGIHGIDAAMSKSRNLTDKERKDIIAFLLTLTDKEFLNDRRFAEPVGNWQ